MSVAVSPTVPPQDLDAEESLLGAMMLSESALCLAQDDLGAVAGVLTPASAMGMKLVTRLRDAGMSFDLEVSDQVPAERRVS